MEVQLHTEADTLALGRALGSLAADGDVLCLSGDLGAGKTALSRGVCEALGVPSQDVTSPTFALLNVYDAGRLEVHHFDLYRLKRAEELDDIGFYEYAGGDGLTIIEWADLFPDCVPEAHLAVQLTRDGAGRRAVLTPHGARYETLLAQLRATI